MNILRSSILAALSAAFLAVTLLPAGAQTGSGGGSSPGMVHIYVGESAKVNVEGVTKVVVSDPSIIDVVPVSTSTLVFNGRKPGSCVVTLFEKSGERMLRVLVEQNTVALALRIKAALGYPSVRITVAEQNIILEGTVETEDDRARAVSIAAAFLPAVRSQPGVAPTGGTTDNNNVYNQMQYAADDTSEGDVADAGPYTRQTPDGIVDFLKIRNQRQIRLRVHVLRFKSSDLKDFGLKFASELTYGVGIIGGQVRNQGMVESFTPGSSTRGGGEDNGRAYAVGYGTLGQTTLEVGEASSVNVGYSVALRTLENKGAVKTLASPVLVTLDGAESSFLAGGKVILTTAGFQNGNYTTQTQTEEVGVKVFFRPKIMPNGRISLFVTPKVSEPPLDLGNGNFFIASRNTRNNVEVRSGDTIILSGLFGFDKDVTVNKFPWLADIPIIGELFKNRVRGEDHEEIVFLVKPEIVDTPANLAVGRDMPVRTQGVREIIEEGAVFGPQYEMDNAKRVVPVDPEVRRPDEKPVLRREGEDGVSSVSSDTARELASFVESLRPAATEPRKVVAAPGAPAQLNLR